MFEVSINDLLKLGLVEDIGKMTQIDSAQANTIIEYLLTHEGKESEQITLNILDIEESFRAYFTLIHILLPQRQNGFSEFYKIAPLIRNTPNQSVLNVKCFSIDKIVDNLLLTDNLIDVMDGAPEDRHYRESIVLLSIQGKLTIDPKANIHKVNIFLDKCFSTAANNVIRENLMK